MTRLTAGLLALLMGIPGYVRFAPGDPARWHVSIGPGPAEVATAGSYTLRRPGTPDHLAQLAAIAEDTPRTGRVAGSVEEGRITWVTRSAAFGFPDYTTAEVADGELRLFARLRFGSGDFGVNRARVRAWLAELDAPVTPAEG